MIVPGGGVRAHADTCFFPIEQDVALTEQLGRRRVEDQLLPMPDRLGFRRG
jgi:hypothetical protein